MDASREAREREKQQLFSRLAELLVEEQTEEGVFDETPHFSVIEAAAVKLGNQLSRKAQERAAGEIVAVGPAKAPCPSCGRECEVRSSKREVASTSGVLEMIEATSHCRHCRRSFFPSAGKNGNG